MITGMSTRSLKLSRHRNGYYFTCWYDTRKVRHFKTFGRHRQTAMTRFSKFHADWQQDANVREGRAKALLTLRAAWERFEEYALGHYTRSDGTLTGEHLNLKHAMVEALDMFGDCMVSDFDLLSLESVQEAMVDGGNLAVSTINVRINKVKRIFKWFAKHGYVQASRVGELALLGSLRPGRTKARVTQAVRPVPIEHVEAVKQHVPPTIKAMVMVQQLTGCRSGELVQLRATDLNMTRKNVWLFTPQRHKTERSGKDRTVVLGPRAIEAITPFLRRSVKAYLFSPKDAMKQRWEACDTHRRKPSERTEDRWLSDRYTTKTYARAITRACEKHDIPHWSPNQLRHNLLTQLRLSHGLDVAQVVAGHSRSATTEIYAEPALAKAIQAMSEVG